MANGPSSKLSERGLSIGELSMATGVNIETIRYYERVGVISHPPRTRSGRRVYVPENRRQLSFVRRARELGFSLAEIKTMLALGGARRMSCREVKRLAMRHLEDIRERIDDLRRLEATFAKTVRQCRGDATPECPLLDDLMTSAPLTPT
jgi:MerR family mercuric resistance operon transcriptional regulator